ncbi:MAG: 4-hydroxy-tetrahydrodipicolinate synthase [Thermosynechococcaceae cyanobacterium]
MTSFGNIVTAMVTPFDREGHVNYDVAEQLAVHLIENGSDALVICGTTGESPTLTWDEEYKLFQVVRDAIAGKGKIIAGTGSNSTTEAIEATQEAVKLGLDGVLQVVPYYNKPPQEGLYQHFRAIAQATPEMPIMLYNIPGRTGQNLEPEIVGKLAEISNIVAIKEASGNLDQVSQVRRLTPSTFDIYSGDDSLTLPMLAVGCRGVVSVASHLVGVSLQKMVQHFSQGNPAAAAEIHLKLLPLFKALFITTNPIPIKAALQMQGWDVGNTRLPLCDLPESLRQQLAQVINDQNL